MTSGALGVRGTPSLARLLAVVAAIVAITGAAVVVGGVATGEGDRAEVSVGAAAADGIGVLVEPATPPAGTGEIAAAGATPALTEPEPTDPGPVTTGPTTPGPVTTSPPPPAGPECRNSHDPACGPFFFDPQPGPDRPMTVEVTAVPATPRVGEPMTFHLVLRDPDGVSYGSTLFDYGDMGIGDSERSQCDKFGPWDPPAPGPDRAVEVQDITHTYRLAGTYEATFSFTAGPNDCVDSHTGRGDDPYSSSAAGSVTITVQP